MMSRNVTFEVVGLSKTFNRRKIFTDISFKLSHQDSLAITGKNGSGKSTFLKICAGVLSASGGKTILSIEERNVEPSVMFPYIGFVAPYLQLYDEFSGWENIKLVARLRRISAPDSAIMQSLQRLNLWERRNDSYKTYSSGMRQRLKYAFALIHEPSVLFLDEPTSNLDQEGIDTVYKIMEEQKRNGILIVATNDHEDIRMCHKVITLDGVGTKRGGQ
jgi:heme exporter protein A